ncbi:MarR family winged helix-turn-helix transcriptional regulator [Sphaerisporangium fuscum]|uniref:MarR family winged helix-turn-helix transcriptional regulator n=1 Tax=Sphaerisporangium fuscum TaxID=2835868 RepID=UPI001BDC822C|nr:MarR family winged helix-turn-helix transcriptional regulator [Sphaerisporangium fuscum]
MAPRGPGVDDAPASGSGASALSADELRVWRAFLRWSENVTAGIAQSLAAEAALSQPDYEVLKRLLEAGGGLSRQALEQSLSWSPSRLSHQLRRMEARGLVGRDDAGYGRYVNVEITADGREVMAAADAAHAAAVRRCLLDVLPADMRAFLLSTPPAPPDDH